jgi:hypothetical protein
VMHSPPESEPYANWFLGLYITWQVKGVWIC